MIDVADRKKKTGRAPARLTGLRIRRLVRDGASRVARAWRVWLVCALVSSAVYGAVWYGLHSERFRAREVMVNRCRHIPHEDLRAMVRIRGERSIFEVDLDAIRRRLEAEPWIAEAQVRRSLPHRIVVRVTEHEPVAVVHLDDFYYLDAKGRVFKKVERGDPMNYPIVTGLTRQDILEGPDADTKLARALELADLAGGRAQVLGGLSEVRVGPMGNFTIVTEREGLVVRLGADRFAEKIDRLGLLLGELGPRSRSVARIDMGVDGRAVVRMASSARGDG